MATWTFSGYNNGRGAEVTFTYTAVFDPETNKTKLTVTKYTAAFSTGGVSAYCALTGTFTVKAADNTGSYETLEVSAEGNGNSPTLSSDTVKTIEVSHGVGKNKKVILSFSGTINANFYYTYPEESVTVTVASATARSLSISAGSGAEISVSRQASPWAPAGSLLGGDAIYDGDVLKISFSALTGYEVLNHTVNGAEFTSGNTHRVSANVTVAATAKLKSYTLTINADSHAQVKVTRGGEILSSGAAVNHFDLLSVTASAKTGYKLSEADVNGTAISPDTAVSHTVSGPVTVTVLTEALSNLILDDNGARKRFLILIDDNGERKYYRAIFK